MYNRPNIIDSFIKRKFLEWFGHPWRADEQLLKNVLVKINTTRYLGRPKIRWIDIVTKDLAMIDQDATLQIAY